MAEAREGICTICHVRLRPQVFQVVRTNDQIVQCDSCQRILYYIPPPPPVEPAVVRTGPARPGADTADIARDWDVPGLLPSSRNPQ